MKCKSCEYPLWKIRDRQCPECGAPFRPSDFEFVLNSVCFRCPHCAQEYYGDGERGHLVPSEFDCVACGKHILMDQMVLEPVPGLADHATEVAVLPWLDRPRVGRLKGWFRTVGVAMIAPKDLMDQTPPDSSAGAAVRFLVFTQVLVMLLAGLPILGLMLFGAGFAILGPGGAVNSSSGAPSGLALVGIMAGATAGMLVVGLLAMLILTGLVILISHGLLAVTGSTRGLRRSVQAVCYSSGANVASAIPCVGGYIGWIWWLVSATVTMKYAHAVAWRRAVLAVVGPIALVVMTVIGVYAGIVVMALGRAQTAAAAAQAAAAKAVGAGGLAGLGAAMGQYRAARGDWPRHAAELVAQGDVLPQDFIATGFSKTTTGNIRVGYGDLMDLQVAQKSEQSRLIEEAVKALDPECPAYRVGDVVVCVRPGQLAEARPSAWVLILWPDPARNPPPERITVLKEDGTATVLSREEFDSALAAENAVRAAADDSSATALRPLPHPRDIGPGSKPVSPEPGANDLIPVEPTVPVPPPN